MAYSGCRDGKVRLIHGRKYVILSEFEAHEGSVDVMAMSPDGTKLATASLDGTAKLWDLVAENPDGFL